MAGEGGVFLVRAPSTSRPGRESWGYKHLDSKTPTRTVVTSWLSVPMATNTLVGVCSDLMAGLD